MTDSKFQPSEADLRDLAALADGSLPERRRAEVEARVAASAMLRDELARQRRALAAIRAASAEAHAPTKLRERVAALERGKPADDQRAERAPAERSWWARWPAVATAGAVAVAAVLALVVLPAGEPAVDEAAQLATRPASEPAPATQEGQPTLLATSFEGLAYPDWEREFGWRAVGERSDELEGRTTHTLFYENPEGRRIGYTIVSGDALDAPSGGKRTVVDGVELTAFAAEGASAVTWLRDGHSCVLAGEGVERSRLLELAAWKGDGAVTF
jgi:hypothetical protein